MCSTPRSSGKVHSSHRIAVGKIFHSSYSQMMRTASIQYEQRQRELAKRRRSLLEKELLEKELSEKEQSNFIEKPA